MRVLFAFVVASLAAAPSSAADKKPAWWDKAVKKIEARVEPAEAKPGQTVTLKLIVELHDGYFTYPTRQEDPQAMGMINTLKFPKDGAVVFVGETADPADYLTKPEPRQITADQTEELPERSRELIRTAVDEYESRQTAEALCAKDADKLEMLLQAIEYRDVGVHRVDGWIESARKSFKTATAQRIAMAAAALSPLAWRDR